MVRKSRSKKSDESVYLNNIYEQTGKIIRFNDKSNKTGRLLINNPAKNKNISGFNNSLDSSLELLLSSSRDKGINRILSDRDPDNTQIGFYKDTYNKKEAFVEKYINKLQYKENEDYENHKNSPKQRNDPIVSENNDMLNRSYVNKLNLTNSKKDIYEPKFDNFEGNIETAYEDMKRFFSDVPRFCYYLRNEYSKYKENYNKVLGDFTEQKLLNKDIITRLEEVLKTSKELSIALVEISNENTNLKNNQTMLENFKEEAEHFIGLIKLDFERNNDQINNLITENNELKCQKTKLEYEKDILNMEKKRMTNSYNIMRNEVNLIKSQMNEITGCIAIITKEMHQSAIYEKIEEVSRQNCDLIQYKNFYVTLKILFFDLQKYMKEYYTIKDIVEQEIKGVTTKCIINEDLLNNRIKKLEEKCFKYEEIIFQQVRPFIRYTEDKIEKLKDSIKQICQEASLEYQRNYFANQIDKQKLEFEATLCAYKNKIKELTKKLEETEDVWDALK